MTNKVNVFLTLERQKRQLLREIAERQRAEDGLEHVNRVLRAIRNVNQLIVREKRPERLVKDACDILVDCRGFNAAWLIVNDSTLGKSYAGSAGLPAGSPAILEDLFAQGNLPQCCQQLQDGAKIIEDRQTLCATCPLTEASDDTVVMLAPIGHAGRQYGYLCVSLFETHSDQEEEKLLLEEVAGDLGYALSGIQAESELRDNEERLRVYFEESLTGMAFVSQDKRWLRVNQSLCDMLGYSRTEMLAMTWDQLTHHEDLQASITKFGLLLAGETEGYTLDKRFIHKDGKVVHTIASVKAVRKPDGTLDVLLVQFQDNTERKQIEEQARQQERLAGIGQLAAGIAHDFNNLLTTIIGYAELLQHKPDMPSGPALGHIIEQGQRAAQLTRQILDFGRQSVRRPRTLDLSAYLQDNIEFVARIIPENIQVELDVKPGNFSINADPTQLQQIITNLAVNARDAMPRGGKLFVCLSRHTFTPGRKPPHLGITPGEWVVLSVTDTGTGIAPEILPHIFEPFFTTKEIGKGSGLGLAQVYGIVKQHGGDITVDSQPGQGTTFTIYFPILPPATKEKLMTEVARPIMSGNKETILVVEDNPTVREVVCAALATLNYQVLMAGDGEEALAVYQEHRNDIALVLTDAVMPKMDGFALVRTLQSEIPDAKVIIMSGYPRTAHPEAATLDTVGWLQKPASVKQLAEAIHVALA